MATTSYDEIIGLALRLSAQEQAELLRELSAALARAAVPAGNQSIMTLRGLGKEIWQGVDAQNYVDSERASWSG